MNIGAASYTIGTSTIWMEVIVESKMEGAIPEVAGALKLLSLLDFALGRAFRLSSYGGSDYGWVRD
jgi:hypothetical protein